MIVTQAIKKKQLQNRLRVKSAEAGFAREIVRGTNCSRFESQIIVDKAKEAFAIGEYEDCRVLLDGQVVFHAVSADAPPGQRIAECEMVRVVLTLLHRETDLELGSLPARRRQQLVRMAVEAREQGCLLTQEDLSFLLGCHVRTVRSDVKALKNNGILVPTRGTIRDIGPGVTHKRKAVELWLSGKEPLEVARAINHSLRAIERYTQTFCRVVYAQRRMRDILKTALVVGISVPAAKAYWDIHCELVEHDSFYRERLDEILGIGETHWHTADGKKSPLRTTKPLEKVWRDS